MKLAENPADLCQEFWTLYGIVGQVKYEHVRGTGYLEMWNYYPPLKPGMPEGAYFSRTLGESGEMGKITGTSNWRKFMLPFDRSGANGLPTRLEVNVFLPGSGTVYLSSVKLMEYNGSLADAVNYTPGAWWSNVTAGWIGAIGGSTLGCLAALLAWLASNGKLRRFVLATSVALIVMGAILLVAGLVALAMRQHYAVWFPLDLLGMLLVTILPLRLKDFRKHYEELEMRKMAAMDATGG